MEDADLKHRFHLMQTEIEANRVGDPEDLHGTLSSRVRQELCALREEAIQAIDPEWPGAEPTRKQ